MKLIASGAAGPAFPGRPSLEEQLMLSLEVTAHGRFVDPATLPTTIELHTVHAQLARICREAARGDL